VLTTKASRAETATPKTQMAALQCAKPVTVCVNLAPRQSGGAFLWMLLGLIGLLGILFVCLHYHWPAAEARLLDNVNTSVAGVAAGTSASASISDGRNVLLQGQVESQQKIDAIVSAAKSTPGVRNVENELTLTQAEPVAEVEPVVESVVQPLAQPQLHVLKNGNQIELSGQVSDNDSAELIRNNLTNLFPDSQINDQLVIDEGTESAGWLEPAVTSLEALQNLQQPELHVQSDNIRIAGVASSETESADISSSVVSSFGADFVLDNSLSVAAAPEPQPVTQSQISIVTNDAGDVTVGGTLPQSTGITQLLAAVRQSTDASVVRNEISVDENASETPWLPFLIDSLRTGVKVKQLQLTADAQSLDMQGVTSDQDNKSLLENTLTSDLGDLVSVETRISVDEPEPAPEPVPEPKPETVPEPEPAPQQPLAERMQGVNTQGILFDSGSDVLRPESRIILDQIAAIFTDYADTEVIIAGYTDSRGNNAENQLLSEARARSVRDYLVSKGLSADKLQAFGYGERAPIADNATAEGRARNRRIEFNF